MSKQTLEIISIHKIEISTTNPRKVFDPKALQELSESIKEHGILQPILVRPYVDEKSSWQDYQLVCGERRYRAALLAGLEEVPVSIRVLTDDEAFELQIIENLERKDVHPLDEADAFKKMLDSKKYTIADIAAKMAKPESFIVQRLKLVDLVEVLRDDFLKGHFGIGHAILLARCDEFKQFDIYEDAQIKNEAPHYPTIRDLKETIEDDSYLLSEAKFDLSDSKLTNVCACNICPKRSGANPVLFADMQDDRCFDQKCFDAKTASYIEKEVARIINLAEGTPILATYQTTPEMVVAICKEYEIPILKQYDNWVSNEREGWNYENGFIVSGFDAGSYKQVYIRPEMQNETDSEAYSSTGSKAPISNEIRELKEEISKIESRADRSIELDGEKVWNQIRAIDTSEIKTIIGGLFDVEVDAVCLAMISNLGYYGNQEVQKIVGKFDIETIQARHFTKFEYNQIQRIFFLECLPTGFGNYYSSVYNYAYTKALNHYHKDEIQGFIDAQKAIADVRLDKADAKIKDLKSKIEKLKPTTPDDHENDEFGNKIIALNNKAQDLKEEVTNWISNKNGDADETSPVSEYPTFEKITRKRFSLNNSYFKNRTDKMPATPLEVMYYFKQHNELPFDMGSDTENWIYECFIEFQKRSGVYGSQFFTPPATAKRMTELADQYFQYKNEVPYILDACCGFGMLTKPLVEKGFIVNGFDVNSGLLELYNEYTGCISKQKDINSYLNEDSTWRHIISNPPYEIKESTQFFKLLLDLLSDHGTSILLLPKNFIDKDKPKALAEVLGQFEVIHREDMEEDFARTKINAEIVVIKKAVS